MPTVATHDDHTFICLCLRCVDADPDTFFDVAYCGHGAPLGASGTRKLLREQLQPKRTAKAQRVFHAHRVEMPADDVLRSILRERCLDRVAAQFFGAYRKGFAVGISGVTDPMNPYSDERTRRGSVTFSRAYRGWWRSGYEDGVAYRASSLRVRKP